MVMTITIPISVIVFFLILFATVCGGLFVYSAAKDIPRLAIISSIFIFAAACLGAYLCQ